MLTQQQIDDIAFYCYTRNVEYYDVQLELVDHIADMIEDLQKTNTALSFSEALELAGKQFSDEEFKKVVRSKKKLLQKKVSKLIEKEFVSFFTVPKIILTITLILGALLLPRLMKESKIIGGLLLLIMMAPYLYYSFIFRNESKQFLEDRKGNLLCLKVRSRYEKLAILAAVSLNTAFNLLPGLFDNHFNLKDKPSLQSILFLFGAMLEILFISILFVRVSFNEKMKEQYPNAFV